MKTKYTRKSATSETVKACASISLTAISAVAMGVLQATTVTNYENKNVIGNKKVAPTDDKTSLESRESSGVSNDSSLSKDDVSAQKVRLMQQKLKAKHQLLKLQHLTVALQL